MRLNITHRTHYNYEPATQRAALRLRLYPSEFDGQSTIAWSVMVNGSATEPLFTDGFGDRQGLWTTQSPCSAIEVIAAGTVETRDTSGVVKGLPRRPPAKMFLRSTRLTEANAAIEDLARTIDADSSLEQMHTLMHAVRAAVDYKSGTTTPQTTAAEALEFGRGVCQDHAHVFIAAARCLKVPARYVAGYMIAGDDVADLHETHAWAEAHIDNLGWVGFDPSNDMCPTERYVRLSSGLDADHAAPLRGSVAGDGSIGLDANVDITQDQQ